MHFSVDEGTKNMKHMHCVCTSVVQGTGSPCLEAHYALAFCTASQSAEIHMK